MQLSIKMRGPWPIYVRRDRIDTALLATSALACLRMLPDGHVSPLSKFYT
jgi:hypothetical protein